MPRRVELPRRAGRRSSAYERGERRTAWIGGILGIAALAVLLWMFAYPYFNPKQRIDQASYCPVEGAISHTAVIIDATDSINGIQRRAIENELAQIRGQIPRFGALAIYALASKGELNVPAFALCNPGRADEIDWLTEGKLLAEKRWNEGFQKPLSLVLDRMLSASPEQQSPLFEAIQSVSVQTFGPPRAKRSTAPKHLIIISDMLQNSESLNLYKGLPAPTQFLNSEEYRKLRADLREVEVAIYFIRRQTRGNVQRPELMKFWESVIAAQGGQLVHFKPLEG